MDGVGGFVEDSCDDARGTGCELVSVVVEDAVDHTAVVNSFRVWVDRVGDCEALVELGAKHFADGLVDCWWGLVLLMVLDE